MSQVGLGAALPGFNLAFPVRLWCLHSCHSRFYPAGPFWDGNSALVAARAGFGVGCDVVVLLGRSRVGRGGPGPPLGVVPPPVWRPPGAHLTFNRPARPARREKALRHGKGRQTFLGFHRRICVVAVLGLDRGRGDSPWPAIAVPWPLAVDRRSFGCPALRVGAV